MGSGVGNDGEAIGAEVTLHQEMSDFTSGGEVTLLRVRSAGFVLE